VLGDDVARLLVRCRYLGLGEVECLEHRYPAVAIAIGGVALQRLDEELGEACLVALAARSRPGDDDAARPGERLQERTAGTGGVDEHHALRREPVEEQRIILGRQVGTDKVERGALSIEGAVADEDDEDLIVRPGARREVSEGLADVLPRRAGSRRRAVGRRLGRQRQDVGVGDAHLLRRVDDCRRPLLELRGVLVRSADTGDYDEVGVLRGSDASGGEREQQRPRQVTRHVRCQAPRHASPRLRR
jgi:hypothetical protein